MSSSMWVRVTLIFTLGVALASGCHLVVGLNEIEPTSGAGGTTSGSGGEGGIGGSGGAGGMPPVCDPDVCDAMDTECTNFSCNADNTACDTGVNLDFGDDCFTTGGGGGTPDGICDGEGVCIDAGCGNGIQDPEETGVDCGGPCNASPVGKCHNTIGCAVNADCKSNVCNMGTMVCDPCTGAADCESGNYCNSENTQGQGGGGGSDPTRGAICEPTKPSGMGESCGNSGGDEECTDGNCVDGFCCNAACTELCGNCGLSGNEGTCSPEPSGTAEVGCIANMANCTQATCNGILGPNACNVSMGTPCINQSCTNGMLTTVSTCQMDGTCMTPAPTACPGNMACSAGGTNCMVPGTCTSSTDCAAGSYCETSTGDCEPQIANGAACPDNDLDECVAGNFCVDNVCCGSAACGTCQACNVSGSLGTCTNVPAPNQDPGTCDGALQQCNGNGACVSQLGATCGGVGDLLCASGNCVDGVCCDNAACGICEACALASNPGTCQPVSPGEQDDSCAAGVGCNTGGMCGGDLNGAACVTASACASGYCVDGFCCDSACNGTCESCTGATNIAGNGICSIVQANTDPNAECVGSDNCCNSAGMCQIMGAGVCM